MRDLLTLLVGLINVFVGLLILVFGSPWLALASLSGFSNLQSGSYAILYLSALLLLCSGMVTVMCLPSEVNGRQLAIVSCGLIASSSGILSFSLHSNSRWIYPFSVLWIGLVLWNMRSCQRNTTIFARTIITVAIMVLLFRTLYPFPHSLDDDVVVLIFCGCYVAQLNLLTSPYFSRP